MTGKGGDFALGGVILAHLLVYQVMSKLNFKQGGPKSSQWPKFMLP